MSIYADKLDNSTLLQQGFKMESTDVYRTIQSGYSELTGMADFLNMSRPELTYAQADALNNNKRGMPPFNVRNAK